MANYKTAAQRYNDRMDKIWEQARKNGTLEPLNPYKTNHKKIDKKCA